MKKILFHCLPMRWISFLAVILFYHFSGSLLAQDKTGLKSNFLKIEKNTLLLASNKLPEGVKLIKLVDITISGTVTDQNGQPIPGATISVPGTSIGTATDLDGRYVLIVPEGASIVVSFIGFESQTVEVGNLTTIDIDCIHETG